jgi:hypothetical protein
MENITEFQHWLDQMLSDSKTKLNLNDSQIAYILIHKGLEYYYGNPTKEK